MNTDKQIAAMVVLLFISLIAVGAYSIWDTDRSESSADDQFAATIERGATTFALNCRVCHGDQGQGGAQDGRLGAALPLDTPRLQGMEDLSYNDAFAYVTETITCGRVGTAMPTWGEAFGGTLNQEQIHQLATLIAQGQWEAAQEHSIEIDAETTEHATLQNPDGGLAADATEITVSNAAPFSPDQRIRIRLPEEEPAEGEEEASGADAEERMLILPNQVEVARGVNGTAPAEHGLGTELVLADPDPGEDAETGITLTVDVDTEITSLPVSDLVGLDDGDIILLEQEQVRIEEIVTGVPTTFQQLIAEIGKTPTSFLATSDENLEEGMMIRVDGELMRIESISDEGDAGIELIAELTASADQIAVSDPAFFRPNYVVRIGDELIRIKDAVSTEQTLGITIGRAQSQIAVSGLENLEEGMTIRIGEELMRITSLAPAELIIERGAPDLEGNETQAAAHSEGDRFFELPPADAEEPPPQEELATGAVLLEDISAEDTRVVVEGTQSILAGSSFQIGDEIVTVTDVQPVIATVERGVDGSSVGLHSRRAEIFNDSLLDVQRAYGGTTAAAHSEGDTLNFTEVGIEREIEGSTLEEHAKGAEIFLGNTLIVERGTDGTTAVEHENGVLVLDFPRSPDNPPLTPTRCGQNPDPTPSGPTPTVGPTEPVDTSVAVTLADLTLDADPTSAGAGNIGFDVTNEGAIVHNFRVIRSDLPEDQLPLAGGAVDEGAVEVVTSLDDLASGSTTTTATQLDAASYILICNIPGHYSAGMYASFTVQ
jgi:uncharacterized cupredoxin-like copper-binding protein/mono/diheme cytochrome c family protein